MNNQTNPAPLKGLRCNILRADKFPDCSMNGISSRVNHVTLVGPGIDRVFNATPEAPAVVLVKRNFGDNDYLHIVPLEVVERGEHAMAGGTFVWTSDSRFPNDYPLSLHDRVEHPISMLAETPAEPVVRQRPPRFPDWKPAVGEIAWCPGGPACAAYLVALTAKDIAAIAAGHRGYAPATHILRAKRGGKACR